MFNRKDKRRLILNLIRKEGRISRFDITKSIKLAASTVGIFIDELIRDGFVREIGLGDSSGGRKPILLELNPEAGYIVGVDFEATSIMVILVNFQGETISSVRGGIEINDDKLVIVRKIIGCIRKAIAKAQVNEKKIMGIGLGVPGLIDSKKGVGISYDPLPNWRDVPLKDLIKMELPMPVYMEKNVYTMALAEKWFGLGRKVSNFICLAIRSGVCAGIVIHNQLYRGASESAGEIGHMVVDRNGARCSCGNRGCLQRLVTDPAIIERAGKRITAGEKTSLKGNKLSLEKIIEEAKKGDILSLTVLKETGEYIGLAVSPLIDFFNPQLIVIAGNLVKAGELILEPLKETVKKMALEMPRRAAGIAFSELGDNIGSLGAANLVLQEKFKFRFAQI